MENNAYKKRRLKGTVTSDAMDKTVVVSVTRLKKDRKYRKYFKTTSRYKAHDELNEYRVNDTVIMEECKPMSKDKRWKVARRHKTDQKAETNAAHGEESTAVDE